MSKELNIIEAMKMPLGTELIIKYMDGYTRKVALVESNEVGNNNVLLKYLDSKDGESHYVDVHRELVEATFIPVSKPVSFMEAVKNGKLIKVEHEFICDKNFTSDELEELKEYQNIDNAMYILSENLDSKQLRRVILNGKWYIEEH